MLDPITQAMPASERTPITNREWDIIRQRRDLNEVAIYRAANLDAVNREEIDKLYNQLKEEELQVLKLDPARCSRQCVEELVSLGVFTYDDFAREGLVTRESWAKLNINHEYLPDITEIQKGATQQPAPEGRDIYFLGMPSSGKSSLLMGICASNGQGYTLDMRSNGGPYAAALRQYTMAGLVPGRTLGKFVTTINGEIIDESRSHAKTIPINLVEMSGEEFALRIAESQETSIANMGTGVTNLMRNDNRKIFFIVVDASRPMVKVSYLDREIDEEGEIIKHVRSRYISQLDVLDKFIALIGMPENKEIMNRVDAIHFIVTKTDSMVGDDDAQTMARDLVNTQYLSVIERLKSYCRSTKRINRQYDFEPEILTYSLGHFYLGDVFDYDSTDTLKIIDAIREASSGKKYRWRKMLDSFSLFL